jgi:DNA-binding transcriptional LysR family regulator
MELRHLRYFVAVAEEPNFSRAARTLNVAQPPLSRQIQNLEHIVDAPLFLRGGRKLELTPAGHAFLKEARATLGQSEWAIKSARLAASGVTGVLRIGYMALGLYSPTFMNSLRDYRRDCPAVNISLVHLSPVAQLEALSARQIDLGILHSDFAVADAFRTERIFEEPLDFMFPAGHPLAARKKLQISDLHGEPFVMSSRATNPPFYDRLIASWAALAFRPNVVCETDSFPTTVAMVAAGNGISFAMRGSAARLSADISVRPVEDFAFELGADVAWLRDNASSELHAFLGFCCGIT